MAALLSNNSFAGIDRVVVDRTGLTTDFDFTVDWSMSAGESLSRPVTDDTGLTGRYDFALYWAARQGDDGSPELPEAVQQQLGLKLERKKGPIDMLVVDRADKTPREN